MGSLFSSKEKETPIQHFGERIFNAIGYSHRGLIGSIPIIGFLIFCAFPLGDLKTKPEKTTLLIWILMFFMLLFQPIRVPGIALIPCFLLPILHVEPSSFVCNNYASSSLILMITGGYLRTLLNCSGVDRRFVVWMLSYTKDSSINNFGLLFKASFAAYFLSMISDRQHVVPFIMRKVCGPLIQFRGEKKATEPNYNKMRYVLSNAIASSATIGSIGVVNGAHNIMFLKVLWDTSDHADTFNFLDYSLFAIPTTIIMFSLNLVYHQLLLGKKKMGLDKMTAIRNSVSNAEGSTKGKKIKRMSCHEKLTILFAVILHGFYLSRWSYFIKILIGSMGWADQENYVLPTRVSKIPDASVSAAFLMITSCIPATFNFVKLFSVETESQLPPAKQDSSILYWKFADKSCNYGYYFLAGSFTVLNTVIRKTVCAELYLWPHFTFFTDKSTFVSVFIFCFGTAVLSNVMTSVGATGMVTILALNFIAPDNLELLKHQQLLVLACGFGGSFGFAPRFMHTPSYYCRTVARLRLFSQIQFAIPSVLICVLCSVLAIRFYAPIMLHMT